MKKSFLALLMAAVLLFSVLAPAALAEKGSTGEKIFSLLKKLQSSTGEEESNNGEKYVVERFLKQAIDSLNDGEGLEGSDIDQLIGTLLGGLSGEEGDTDLSAIIGLLGSFLGSGDEGEDDFEALLNSYYESDEYIDQQAKTEAVENYIFDEYKDAIELGDVQIMHQFTLYRWDGPNPENMFFGYFTLSSFKADGTDLKFIDNAGCLELLTVEKNEDGTYSVVEAIRAEEGDDYEDTFAALCETFGTTVENAESDLSCYEWYVMYELGAFLKEHPEYERIEYDGELRTAEELSALEDAFWAE